MEVLEHQRNDMIELKTGLLHHVSFLANTNTQHSILVECILYKTVIYVLYNGLNLQTIQL
jgi:hypothetical protein